MGPANLREYIIMEPMSPTATLPAIYKSAPAELISTIDRLLMKFTVGPTLQL